MSGASPSPADSSLDEATEEGFILASINTLLNRVGISAKPINSFEELRKSASSMFVAIFEAMFQVRQKGVVRKPAHVHNYVHNAQMVVDALAGPILNMDLSHITGEAIVRGDTVAIRNLVDIFMGISEVVIKRQGETATKKFFAGSRRRLKVRQSTPQRGLPLQQQQDLQEHGNQQGKQREDIRRHQLDDHQEEQQQQQQQQGQYYQPHQQQRILQHRREPPWHPSSARTPSASHSSRIRQSGIRISNRARDLRSIACRGPCEEFPALTNMGRAYRHRAFRGESGMDDEAGESTGRSELSPFLREVGSLSSPPGEGLTARDILEAHRFEEEERRAEMDGMEDESEGELLAGPLRDAELGMKQNTSRQEEEREMKYRLYYQRVLKDRLTALRKRELADARKQHYAYKNARHLARVRQIKKERMEENLRLARLSQRLRLEDDSRGRLNHLYEKILTALHRQRKEDDREDAARLKALHLGWQAQADDLEKFFNERVELVVEHERGSARDRAQAMASEERDLIDFFRRAEMEYEEHLVRQIEQRAVEAAAQERHKAELRYAYKELLRMEDWSGASRDRFLGVRPNTAFEQRLKQVRVRADRARSRLLKEKKERNLVRAYGRAA